MGRVQQRRQKVCHRLPHAGARLDDQPRAPVDRLGHRAGHGDLLFTLLEAGYDAAQRPTLFQQRDDALHVYHLDALSWAKRLPSQEPAAQRGRIEPRDPRAGAVRREGYPAVHPIQQVGQHPGGLGGYAPDPGNHRRVRLAPHPQQFQEDAPGGHCVLDGAMGPEVRYAEALGQPPERIVAQAGHQHVRQVPRVAPLVDQLHPPAPQEIQVEAEVVADEGGRPDERGEAGRYRRKLGCPVYVGLGDAGIPPCEVAQPPAWIDEGVERIDDLVPVESDGAYLDDLVVLLGEAGGLQIDGDPVVVEGGGRLRRAHAGKSSSPRSPSLP